MSDKYPHLDQLLSIMATLRDPERGCPWDRRQTFATIVPFTLEEAYEVAETIAQEDWPALKGELGDLLFQVVFYCQMAQEQGWFGFDQVAEAMAEKLIRRHPHVFADARFADEASLKANWEQEKARERQARAAGETSVLDDIPHALPALSRAAKLQKRCARVGFDWPTLEPVAEKVEEELDEVMAETRAENPSRERLEDELGDLLFAAVNLSRHLKLDPETALRRANAKFERRFRAVEQHLRDRGLTPEAATLSEMDQLWEQVKREKM